MKTTVAESKMAKYIDVYLLPVGVIGRGMLGELKLTSAALIFGKKAKIHKSTQTSIFFFENNVYGTRPIL